MSDKKTDTTDSTPGTRFAFDGPGNPYMAFATAASLVIVASIIFVPTITVLFGYTSPVWIIGHACIFAGGYLLNRGNLEFGRSLVRIACATVLLLYAIILVYAVISQPAAMLFLAIGGDNGAAWILSFTLLSIPIYFCSVICVLISTYPRFSPRSQESRGGS